MLQYRTEQRIVNEKGHYEQAQIYRWEGPSLIWWREKELILSHSSKIQT